MLGGSPREGANAMVVMAMPVIDINWSGWKDYLDSSCGVLVEPTSRDGFVAGLSDAPQALAKQPDRRIFIGRLGRQKVIDYFDGEVNVDNIVDVYQQVGGARP